LKQHGGKTRTLISELDVNKLQQAFLNLIKNAMESITEAEGKITITVDKHGKIILSPEFPIQVAA